MRRASQNGYVIKVIADPTLNFNEIGIELVGKELLMSASAHLEDLTIVTDYFLTAIKTRDTDELHFNRREVVEMPDPSAQVTDIRDKMNTGFLAGLMNATCYIGSTISAYGLGKIADGASWNFVIQILFVASFAAVLLSVGVILVNAIGKNIKKKV